MRNLLPIVTAALAVSFTMACEPANQTPDVDDYARHLPDERILIAMPVTSGDRTVGALADTYVTTAQVTTDVNGMIGSVLDTVGHITDFEPTYSSENDEFFWGPWNDGGLDPNETGLWVALDAATQEYGWAIVQRPKDSESDDDWVAIAAGSGIEGDDEDSLSGGFIVDFDAIASLNPASTERGIFASAYVVDGDDVEAEAAFQQFTDDADNPERLDAVYGYGQDGTGAGYMDLGYLADATEEGELETIVLRTRWTATGAGRGDMVIFGGDVAPLVYQATECWGDDYNVSYEENNADFTMNGDEATCAFAEPEWNDDAPEA